MRQKLSATARYIHCLSLVIKRPLLLCLVSQEVESQLSLTMCRAKAVGTVVAEPARAEPDTLMPYTGADAPSEPLGTADFALQLISMLLILLTLSAAAYFSYKRRQMKRKSYTDGQRGWDQRGPGSGYQDGQQSAASSSNDGTRTRVGTET